MIALFWQAGWVAIFAWLTYATAQSVLAGRKHTLDQLPPGLYKFHHRLMQPFGAVLTFVMAILTLGTSYSLIQMLLSQ